MKDILDDHILIEEKEVWGIKSSHRFAEYRLDDGRSIRFYNEYAQPICGAYVEIDLQPAPDELYKVENARYEIKNAMLIHEYYIETYRYNNQHLSIDGSRINGVTRGSRIYLNGKPAPNGVYRINWWKKFNVLDGRLAG